MSQEPTILEEGMDGTTMRNRIVEALTTVLSLHAGATDPTDIPGMVVADGLTWLNTTASPYELKLYLPAAGTADGYITLLFVDAGTGAVSPGPDLQILLDLKLNVTGSVLPFDLVMDASYTPTVDQGVTTKLYVDATSRPDDVRWMVGGVASVQAKVAQALLSRPCKFSNVKIYSDTAPVGSALTVSVVRKRTGSGDVTSTASVLAGQNSADVTVTVVDCLAGDRLELNVTGVGLTTEGGNDLLVTVKMDPP